jgi:hypothetical protein
MNSGFGHPEATILPASGGTAIAVSSPLLS